MSPAEKRCTTGEGAGDDLPDRVIEFFRRLPSLSARLRDGGAFTVDSTEWFRVAGVAVESGDNLILRVPMLEDTLFYGLADL